MEGEPPKSTGNGESQLIGVSVRAWIAYTLTLGIIAGAIIDPALRETLANGFLLAIGFYFGQKKNNGR